MDERTTGIILRTRPLTETSLIVQWITRDFGRLSTVAKGARRPKSAFLGKLDLFYLADFTFHPSKRSELHSLREVSVREFHEGLRRELGYLQQASYFAQLLEHATEVNTPLPGFFELFAEALEVLPRSGPQGLTVYAFETHLLAALGLSPEFSQSSLTPGSREVVRVLSTSSWTAALRLKISSAQAEEIERFLHQFLVYHLGRVPAGRALACHPS